MVILDEMDKFLARNGSPGWRGESLGNVDKDLNSRSVPDKHRSRRAGPSDPRGLTFPLKKRRVLVKEGELSRPWTGPVCVLRMCARMCVHVCMCPCKCVETRVCACARVRALCEPLCAGTWVCTQGEDVWASMIFKYENGYYNLAFID